MKQTKNQTKKLSKKFLVFGIAGIFAFAMVTAALVTYLSNTAEVKMKVNSPMEVMFSNNNGWVESLELADTTGLSTVNFYAQVTNKANNEIISPNLIVSLDNGLGTATCNDLTSIKFTDTWCHGEASTDCPEQEIYGIAPCDDSSGKALFTIPTEKYKVGQQTTYPVAITFANVEPSTYTIEGTMKIASA
jgi:hypothetical protein